MVDKLILLMDTYRAKENTEKSMKIEKHIIYPPILDFSAFLYEKPTTFILKISAMLKTLGVYQKFQNI
jgi:hypothetical protein